MSARGGGPPPLSHEEVEALWRESGALLEGHFLYTSGRHGAHYLEKFRVLERPAWTARLVATWLRDLPALAEAEAVLGPTTGGALLAFELARQLEGRALIAERAAEGQGRELRRGFHLAAGERVAIVDDVVTTGGSVAQVVAVAEAAGARVLGVAVLADRSAGELARSLRVPLTATLSLDLPSYPAAECPLCAAGVPLSSARGTGHRDSGARPATP